MRTHTSRKSLILAIIVMASSCQSSMAFMSPISTHARTFTHHHGHTTASSNSIYPRTSSWSVPVSGSVSVSALYAKKDKKNDYNEYLNSLKGAKSKTYVVKKRADLVKEANETRDNPLKSIFQNKKSEKGDSDANVVNTMESQYQSEAGKKRKSNAFAFLDDLRSTNTQEIASTSTSTPYVPSSSVTRAVAPTPVNAASATDSIEKLPKDNDANADATDKFTFAQKFESIKTGVVGLLVGGIAVTPVTAIHDIVFPGDTISNGLAQWEFDTDTGSITAALFAIVYRYCVREGEEKNEMLPMGVIGAFAIVRTVSRVRVSYYCDAVPLDCGSPLGYLDWAMLQQLVFSGVESAALFGATAAAMDYCYTKGYISRFK